MKISTKFIKLGQTPYTNNNNNQKTQLEFVQFVIYSTVDFLSTCSRLNKKEKMKREIKKNPEGEKRKNLKRKFR